jgi:hypothetical protein
MGMGMHKSEILDRRIPTFTRNFGLITPFTITVQNN